MLFRLVFDGRRLRLNLRTSQFQSFLSEHPEAQKRYIVLRPILDGTITIEQAAAAFQISEKTIDRWKAQYAPDHWYSLLPQSRSPHTRPRKLTPLERKQRPGRKSSTLCVMPDVLCTRRLFLFRRMTNRWLRRM